jgi:hypothetical protein
MQLKDEILLWQKTVPVSMKDQVKLSPTFFFSAKCVLEIDVCFEDDLVIGVSNFNHLGVAGLAAAPDVARSD